MWLERRFQDSNPGSVCCVLEQNTLSALLQSTQLQNEKQGGDNLVEVKDSQCYELFGGIALKSNAVF